MLPSLARFFLGLRKSDSGPGSTKAESYGPASCGIWGALISIAAAEDVGHFLIEEDVVKKKKGGDARAYRKPVIRLGADKNSNLLMYRNLKGRVTRFLLKQFCGTRTDVFHRIT